MNINKIKELCDKNNLSIHSLAEAIGYSKQGLYLAITRETIKAETLEKIADVLQVPIWVFFDLDPVGPLKAEIEQLKKKIEKLELERQIDEGNFKFMKLGHESQKEKIQLLLDKISIMENAYESQKELIDLYKNFEALPKPPFKGIKPDDPEEEEINPKKSNSK